MPLLAKAPQAVVEKAHAVASAVFSRKKGRIRPDVTTLALRVLRLAEFPDHIELPVASPSDGWLFLVYFGKDIAGTVEIVASSDGPNLAKVEADGSLREPIKKIENLIEVQPFEELGIIEAPALNSHYFFLRGPNPLFVERLSANILGLREWQTEMARRAAIMIGPQGPRLIPR